MKTKADPTGQAKTRRKAIRPYRARLKQAERKVLDLIAQIPTDRRVIKVNADKVVYDWLITPEQLADTRARIALEIQAEMEVLADKPPQQWYGEPEMEQAARAGTLEATNTLNRNIAALAAGGFLVRGLKPQPVDAFGMLSAPQVRNGLKRNILTLYTSVKAVAERLTGRVSNNVIKATTSRLSPRALRKEVRSSFDIARNEIKRSVDTSINQAYTDGIQDAAVVVAEQTDTTAKVMHISALTSTTRAHHAARHRKVYTVEEQEAWWDEGANRISCKCSVLPVLEP